MKKFIIVLLVCFVAFGIETEFISISDSTLLSSSLPEVLLAILILLLYFVTIILLLKLVIKKWQLKNGIVYLSLFVGLFATGFIPLFTNETVDEILKLANIEGATNEWISALATSIVEELIKVAIALAIIYTLSVHNIKAVFVIGASVGLGFQFIEDIGYILNVAKKSELIYESLNRLSGSFTSHWMLTSIFTVCSVVCLRKHIATPTKYKCLLVSPIILHLLWNSPINTIVIVSATLTAITLLIAISIFNDIQKKIII